MYTQTGWVVVEFGGFKSLVGLFTFRKNTTHGVYLALVICYSTENKKTKAAILFQQGIVSTGSFTSAQAVVASFVHCLVHLAVLH